MEGEQPKVVVVRKRDGSIISCKPMSGPEAERLAQQIRSIIMGGYNPDPLGRIFLGPGSPALEAFDVFGVEVLNYDFLDPA